MKKVDVEFFHRKDFQLKRPQTSPVLEGNVTKRGEIVLHTKVIEELDTPLDGYFKVGKAPGKGRAKELIVMPVEANEEDDQILKLQRVGKGYGFKIPGILQQLNIADFLDKQYQYMVELFQFEDDPENPAYKFTIKEGHVRL
ncbi:hypothetical protein CLV58_109192 [Spirosoma oryzae]|uniref:Uncharacterized protein n=1 Tax=Spirosoma oryzae TaxID=1469603 RepID=A0A2T0SYH9_9BACT|nr:hypothetical protein [Spirosoma oryzae]PRY38465.1 hypothetical protein CLV58_109192 [Spirosoma oryzae]